MVIKIHVTIDSREQSRIASATQYYEKQGHEVTVAELPIGDYLFTNNTDSVVFEFKTMPDFFSSIQNGRVFNEAINQAENFDHHFVIIHGNEHTRNKCIAMSRNWRPINIQQYLGAIASLNRYTTVIEVPNPDITEAYYRMQIQAEKCLQNKPIVQRHPRKHRNPAFNFLCYCIYGLNSHKATRITETLQLHTLTDLQKLTHEQLTSINGIGEKTAENIIQAIQGK